MMQEEREQIANWLASLSRPDFARQLGRFRLSGEKMYSPDDYEELKPIFDAEVVARTTGKNPCHGNPRPTLPGVRLDRKDWAVIRTLKMGQIYQAFDKAGVQWDFKRLYGAQPRYRVWTTDKNGKVLAGEATLPNPLTQKEAIRLAEKAHKTLDLVPLAGGELVMGGKAYYMGEAIGLMASAQDLGPKRQTNKLQEEIHRFWQRVPRQKNPLTDPEATTLLQTAKEHMEDARHHKSAMGASFDYGVASGIGESISLAGPAWAKRKMGRGEHAIARKLHNPRFDSRIVQKVLQAAIESGAELSPEVVHYLDKGRYTFGGKPWRESIKEIRLQTVLGRRAAGRTRWIGTPVTNPNIRPTYDSKGFWHLRSKGSGGNPGNTVYGWERDGVKATYGIQDNGAVWYTINYEEVDAPAEMHREIARHFRLPMKNPHQAKPALIGEHCLAVEYEDVGKAKREGVANPKRPWRHDFTKSGAKVYGLPDGSVLIKGPHRLWRSQKNTVTGK